jgi:hypothetical protein
MSVNSFFVTRELKVCAFRLGDAAEPKDYPEWFLEGIKSSKIDLVCTEPLSYCRIKDNESVYDAFGGDYVIRHEDGSFSAEHAEAFNQKYIKIE